MHYKPHLSILIPSIPSRFETCVKLYTHIQEMVGDKNIEILMFTDNKKRSIGMKREALKNISKGIFFMFVDDDDSLLTIDSIYSYIDAELKKPADVQNFVDVITFKYRCRNANGSEYIVTFGMGNDIEHTNDGNGNYIDLKRPPFHVCAWNERFKRVPFGDKNYGEDAVFVLEANKWVKTEHYIDEIVGSYNFNPNVTEAGLPQ